jgi:hypothetical protein
MYIRLAYGKKLGSGASIKAAQTSVFVKEKNYFPWKGSVAT